MRSAVESSIEPSPNDAQYSFLTLHLKLAISMPSLIRDAGLVASHRPGHRPSLQRLQSLLDEGQRFADEQKSTLVLLDKSSLSVDGLSLCNGVDLSSLTIKTLRAVLTRGIHFVGK